MTWNPHGPPGPHGYPQQGQPQPMVGQPAFGADPKGGFGQGFFPQGTQHEFGPAENAEMSSTATWAKALGIVGFVEAGFDLLNGNIIGAGIAVGIAVAFFQAGQSLKNVVATQGHDMHHLMKAVQQIGSAFQIRIVVMLIAVGFMSLIGIGGIVIAIVASTS